VETQPVDPQRRGRGAADAILAARVERARQHAALGSYRWEGFTEVPRFPPYTAGAMSICTQREVA
jgi:GNAT superfamily N-acetyltransferase